MKPRKPQTHPSGATDAVLASDDADEALDTLLESMTEAGATGIRIDAPFVVDPGGGVPVIGAFVRVPEPGEAFDNGVAVIAVSNGALVIEPALRTPKMKGGRGAPETDVTRGSSFSFDAAARLPSVDFGKGARLWVAYGPYLSNGLSVRAGGDALRAPEDGIGLAVEVSESAVTEPGGTVEISGRAPASQTVHLVVMGRADPFHYAAESGADGSFAVNLLGDNPLPKAPGTWHVYAFSGEHAAGPATIELTPGTKPW